MTEDDPGTANARTLTTIARALDVPLETFFDPTARDPAVPPEAEEVELLRLFRAIHDPQQRAHCLALIRGMANLTQGETSRP